MDILLLLGILACPLGMLAMGGLAWLSGKMVGRHSEPLERVEEGQLSETNPGRRAAAMNGTRDMLSRG